MLKQLYAYYRESVQNRSQGRTVVTAVLRLLAQESALEYIISQASEVA
jgi:hypothetical protein